MSSFLFLLLVVILVSYCHGFQPRNQRRQLYRQRASLFSTKDLLTSVTDQIKDIFSLKKSMVEQVTTSRSSKESAKQYDEQINQTKAFLLLAATTKAENSDKVCDNLLSLEKLMRAKAKLDDGESSRETLKNLNGAWRLIFTTGTIDTQKKYGKVNYFPIKAAQCFDTSTMTLTNGIFLGDFAVLKFFGSFEWKEKARKLEFDFDAIAVAGIKFNLPKGGAAKIGSRYVMTLPYLSSSFSSLLVPFFLSS